jgi:type IV secretion system protein VirB10
MTTDSSDIDVHGDDHDLLETGRRRRQLTSIQKVGVGVLVAVVFLSFIWIDYSLQLKAGMKQPDLAFRPKLGNYRAAPITMPTPEISAAPTSIATGNSAADSPILAFGETTDQSAEAAPETPMATPQLAVSRIVPPIGARADDADGSIAAKLKPTVLEGSKAATLPHPDFLITKGTIIPCTLQTAINTELPGFVKCVLPEAVRGATGNVVLLDRGTTVVGEIQSSVAQGQHRAFVLWDRAETPSHAVVTLASPSADELGRSGVPGRVNNHFWQRFGGAMLLTVVQGSFQTGTALAGRSGGASAYVNSLQSNGQQVADTALQSSINIPPTLEKKQGETVSIFTARDIDFSDVYSLKLNK